MFVIEVPFFNLDQIYKSGQAFRWIKLRDQKYVIPFGSQALKIEQQKQRLIMSCNEEDFYNIWFDYFDLKTDYMSLNYSIRHIDKLLKVCAVRGNGIHILNQDLFEIIITSILVTTVGISRAKKMLNTLCMNCGTKHKQSMREAGKIIWYEFPTPKMIVMNQDKLSNLGFNRKEHIIQISKDIIDGWLNLYELTQMNYKEAKEYLIQFDGIDSKIADYICLYSLHHMESFPMNTYISQALRRDYNCDDYELFKEWYLEEAKKYAGIIQQYLLHNEINQPKEVIR